MSIARVARAHGARVASAPSPKLGAPGSIPELMGFCK